MTAEGAQSSGALGVLLASAIGDVVTEPANIQIVAVRGRVVVRRGGGGYVREYQICEKMAQRVKLCLGGDVADTTQFVPHIWVRFRPHVAANSLLLEASRGSLSDDGISWRKGKVKHSSTSSVHHASKVRARSSSSRSNTTTALSATWRRDKMISGRSTGRTKTHGKRTYSSMTKKTLFARPSPMLLVENIRTTLPGGSFSSHENAKILSEEDKEYLAFKERMSRKRNRRSHTEVSMPI